MIGHITIAYRRSLFFLSYEFNIETTVSYCPAMKTLSVIFIINNHLQPSL